MASSASGSSGLVGAITTSVLLSSDNTKKGLRSPPSSLYSTTALTKASADYQAQMAGCVVSVGQCNIRTRLPTPNRSHTSASETPC